MELIIILVLVCIALLLTLMCIAVVAALLYTLPNLQFRIKKTEENLEKLDENLASFYDSIGLNERGQYNQGSSQQGQGDAMNSVPTDGNGQPLKRPTMKQRWS